MKQVTKCLYFAFGVASTIALALLYSRVFCRRVGTTERVTENIKETLDEAAQAIEKGAEMVEGAIRKARK